MENRRESLPSQTPFPNIRWCMNTSPLFLGMVVYHSDASTQKPKEGGSLVICGWPRLHSEFQDSLDYIVRAYLRTQRIIKLVHMFKLILNLPSPLRSRLEWIIISTITETLYCREMSERISFALVHCADSTRHGHIWLPLWDTCHHLQQDLDSHGQSSGSSDQLS